jgi:hypothetical protein
MKELLPYIVDKIEKSKVRHEVHSFDSGALMIDIWIADSFYVIQIEEKIIGLSLITEEEISFDTIPDQSFKDANEFKLAFENIFL